MAFPDDSSTSLDIDRPRFYARTARGADSRTRECSRHINSPRGRYRRLDAPRRSTERTDGRFLLATKIRLTERRKEERPFPMLSDENVVPSRAECRLIDPSFRLIRDKNMPRRVYKDPGPRLTLAQIAAAGLASPPLPTLPPVAGKPRTRRDAEYESLIRKTLMFCLCFGAAGTLETARKGRSHRRSRIKQPRTPLLPREGRPPPVFQDRDRRWPRAISRRRRRRSTIHRFSTPWIATRNVSTRISLTYRRKYWSACLCALIDIFEADSLVRRDLDLLLNASPRAVEEFSSTAD